MKKGICYTFLLFTLASVFSFKNYQLNFSEETEHGIQFHKGTWAEALEMAKKEKKLIFLDIYATWCGPCKMLKKNTFQNTEVGAFFNANFINVALDGEQGEGELLAKKYHIEGVPALFFIDKNGKIIHETGGYYDPSGLIELGKKQLKKKK